MRSQAQILPPINSMNRFEIASPNPVPPNLRVVEVSTCVKLSKIAIMRSAGIPIPVSDTVKWSAPDFGSTGSALTITVTSP